MMESAHTRDGGKEAETQWGGASSLGNGFSSEGAAKWIPDQEKSAEPQAPPASELESISGEFALIISGHSLVSNNILMESVGILF